MENLIVDSDVWEEALLLKHLLLLRCFSMINQYCTITFRRNKGLIMELSTPPAGSKDLYFSTKYSQTFFTQCMACLWKQHLSYWRNPPYSAVRLLFTTIIALLFGTIFWDIGSKRYQHATNVTNFFASFLSPFFYYYFIYIYSYDAGKKNKTYSMQWDPCMLQYSSLGYKMLHLCNQL